MPLFAEQLPWFPIVPMAVLAITACAAVWLWAATRWRHGRTVVAYQPRRRVPWHAVDLAAIVLFYLFVQSGTLTLTHEVFDANPESSSAAAQHEKSTSTHVVAQLMAEKNIWVLLLCFVSAAVVAPVCEEFLFRVLLQGWFEAREHRWRRRFAKWGQRIPRGILPILPAALVFAAVHFRWSAPQVNARLLILGLTSNAVANVLALIFAVEWLRWRVGATSADFGCTSRKMLGDVVLGLAAFAAVAVPVYAMQSALLFVLPESIAPDPLPLFFFALALGILYYRTHRIVPLIVLHAALNGTSLLLPWLGS